VAGEVDPAGFPSELGDRGTRTEEVGRRESEERRLAVGASVHAHAVGLWRRYDKLAAASDRHKTRRPRRLGPYAHRPPARARWRVDSSRARHVQFEPGSHQERRAWPARSIASHTLVRRRMFHECSPAPDPHRGRPSRRAGHRGPFSRRPMAV